MYARLTVGRKERGEDLQADLLLAVARVSAEWGTAGYSSTRGRHNARNGHTAIRRHGVAKLVHWQLSLQGLNGWAGSQEADSGKELLVKAGRRFICITPQYIDPLES